MSNYWPGYREDKPRERRIARLEWKENRGAIIYFTEQNQEKAIPVNSWQGIKDALFAPTPQLELFVSSMLGNSWFQEACADPEAHIIVPTQIYNKVSYIAGIRVQVGRFSAWVVDCKAWQIATLGLEEAQQLKRLYTLCGVGNRPTPGALGQALMRKHWYQTNTRSVARPNNYCRMDILENTAGGRVDYFVSPNDHFIEVHEYDIVSAYSSVSSKLPMGTSIARFSEPKEEEGYTCWFMRCRVSIPSDTSASVGIFAVSGRTGNNEYPVEPGEYNVWLWKDEIEACRKVGWTVEVHDGWSWREWTTGLATWAEQMLKFRALADDELAAKWIKLATVAGIGRFGMPLYRYKLAEEGSIPIKPGDMMLTDSQGETGYALIRESDMQNNHMSHWFSYILMRCRMVLYRRIRRDIALGITVYCSNYDGYYTDQEVPDLAEEGIKWKHKVLHDVSFPFPRGVVSREKVTLPGVLFDDRKNYANSEP